MGWTNVPDLIRALAIDTSFARSSRRIVSGPVTWKRLGSQLLCVRGRGFPGPETKALAHQLQPPFIEFFNINRKKDKIVNKGHTTNILK